MCKIEEGNYKNVEIADERDQGRTEPMIKDGLDIGDKPFSWQCTFSHPPGPKIR